MTNYDLYISEEVDSMGRSLLPSIITVKLRKTSNGQPMGNDLIGEFCVKLNDIDIIDVRKFDRNGVTL